MTTAICRIATPMGAGAIQPICQAIIRDSISPALSRICATACSSSSSWSRTPSPFVSASANFAASSARISSTVTTPSALVSSVSNAGGPSPRGPKPWPIFSLPDPCANECAARPSPATPTTAISAILPNFAIYHSFRFSGFDAPVFGAFRGFTIAPGFSVAHERVQRSARVATTRRTDRMRPYNEPYRRVFSSQTRPPRRRGSGAAGT